MLITLLASDPVPVITGVLSAIVDPEEGVMIVGAPGEVLSTVKVTKPDPETLPTPSVSVAATI